VERFAEPGVVAEVDHGCVAAGGVHEVEVGEGEFVMRVAVASHECFDGVERVRRERREAADDFGAEGGRFAVGASESCRAEEMVMSAALGCAGHVVS
jgi:hypothetical protein